MKNIQLLLLIAGLFASVAIGQDESDKVPLNLERFVKPSAIGSSKTDLPKKEVPHAVIPKRKADSKGQTEVSTDYSRQYLTNGRGTWDEARIGVVHKFTKRKVLYASYAETKRFEQRDRSAMLGFYQPLDDKWTVLVEASASPTHRVLAKWSGMAQIERSFGSGWIGQGGYRRSEYNSEKVNVGILGVEKYWGHNRAAYSFLINNLKNAGTNASNIIRYNRYYGGDLSSFGVSFAAGREAEETAPGIVLQSDFYNASVNGKHKFSRRWAFAYGYTHQKQGNIYTRRGLSFGLRYKF